MLEFALRRLSSTFIVLALVGIIVFMLVHLAPGDPAAIMAGNNAVPAQVEAIREQLGLDRPLFEQFLIWGGSVLRGDLGNSIASGAPVLDLITSRVGPTGSLALMAIIFAVPAAVIVGVLAAANPGSLMDRLLMAFSAISFSVPAFVIGYFLVYVFAIRLQWLPVQGYVEISEGLWPWFQRLIMPSFTLALAYLALISRVTRTAMLNTLSEDYIRTAKAKGLSRRRVLLHHALRNSGIPIITIVGIGFALLIGGVVITETVFNIPGIGRLVVDAILQRDYPVIQGVTLVLAATYVVVNLLIDISYTMIDPRVSY